MSTKDKGLQMQPATPMQAEQEICLGFITAAHTRGQNPEKDARVEAAWKEVAGLPFHPMVLEDDRGLSTILHGPPGHGKTSVVQAAAMRAAEAMGMNFVEADKDGCVLRHGSTEPEYLGSAYEVTENDFVFFVREMAGQTSAIQIAGAPSLEVHKATGQKYTAVLPDIMFLLGKRAGAGCVLFDDLGNAAPPLIPVVLGMFHEGTYGHHYLGDHMICCGTTNLGAAYDNTQSTTSLGTAIATRCRNFFVKDTATEWVNRYWRKLASNGLSDVIGFVGFMNKHPELVDEAPPKDKRSPYANPRTLERLAETLRDVLYRATSGAIVHGGFSRKQKVDRDLVRVNAAGLVGKPSADKLSAYYDALMNQSLPRAQQFMSAGSAEERERLIKEITEQHLKHGGVRAEEQYFQYQFGVCCADLASAALNQDITDFERLNAKAIKEMRKDSKNGRLTEAQVETLDTEQLYSRITEISERFAQSANFGHKGMHTHGLSHLIQKLATLLPEELSEERASGGRYPRIGVLQAIMDGYRSTLASWPQESIDVIVEEISQMKLFKQSADTRGRDEEQPAPGR